MWPSCWQPHAPALVMHVHDGDARIRDLVRAGAGLADELGIEGVGWTELFAALDDSGVVLEMPTGRRDDYALAAGADANPRAVAPIARGVASSTGAGSRPESSMRPRTPSTGTSRRPAARWWPPCAPPSSGPTLRPASRCWCDPAPISGSGALDADGHATLPLVDAQQRALTESAAWDHDWTNTSVIIGAEASESRETRERVRRWARARLEQPTDDSLPGRDPGRRIQLLSHRPRSPMLSECQTAIA